MSNTTSLKSFGNLFAALAVLFAAGCATDKPAETKTAAPATTAQAQPSAAKKIIRIKAGLSTPLTDAEGNVWMADQGFADGETVQRPEVTIANAKNPMIYQSERYSMTAFSYAVPNGKYIVKLHFAETFEGITAAGQRVFSFEVEGHATKDLDLFAKVGALHPYVETVPVDIKDGKLDIKFMSNIENPEINGIEIIPAS